MAARQTSLAAQQLADLQERVAAQEEALQTLTKLMTRLDTLIEDMKERSAEHQSALQDLSRIVVRLEQRDSAREKWFALLLSGGTALAGAIIGHVVH